MAVFAVYIEKQTQYFGELQTFGNTYHYQTAPGQDFQDEAVAELVASEEQAVTAFSADFISWTTWGPTDGTPLANVIRQAGELDFSGGGADSTGMYKEACALVVWEISRSPVLNRRRWLRKFIRLPGILAGSLDTDTVSGQAPLSEAQQDAFVQYGNNVKAITPGPVQMDPYTLCTEDGDAVPLATNAQVRPYLYTRQIGRS